MNTRFSIARFIAIVRKEFILMKRDPGVIVIMAILPLILICLAGYAVNLNPKHVPTVVIDNDHSDITRSLIHSMNNTNYFSIIDSANSSEKAYHLMRRSKAILLMNIPVDFTRNFIRNKNPEILFEDGGTDTFSSTGALTALSGLKQDFLMHYNFGALNQQKQTFPTGFRFISHRIYDPEHSTKYNVIPGMIGLVLMLTMLMITIVIAFRDIQGGTIEYLLVSPTQPIEILLAEIVSYIIIGYIQIVLGLMLSYYLFDVPFVGSVWLLLTCALPYIIAELSLGLTIATFCSTQFQAVQINNLFIAFSILLTGFIFPIFAMPLWAQELSNFIPLTHFLQILRGIMLKGNDAMDVWQNLWPLLLYGVVMITIAIVRFKRRFN